MRMMRVILWGLSFVALLFGGLNAPVSAQGPDVLEFPETRYTVSGDFLAFWRTIPDPLLVLGYPISEPFKDAFTGSLVQYFDRGRLELNANAPKNQRVTLTNLGELLYTRGAPLADVPNAGPACRLFPQTGLSVCYAFLDFYEKHGGAAYFGQPISQSEIHNGRTVQYFERARLEWRGEAPAGQRVGLGNLGRQYLDMVGRPDSQTGSIPQKLSSLKVRAFVSEALLTANSQQKVFVVVQDQALKPVESAVIGLIVTTPDGKQAFYRPGPSDKDGISMFEFPVGAVATREIVRIDVVASYSGMEQRASTWFRIWW